MTQTPGRPLHRLTPLRDDPAAAWLTPAQRWRVSMTAFIAWTAFWVLGAFGWLAMLLAVRMGFLLTSLYWWMGVIAVIWPVRRIVMRRSNATMVELVRSSTPAAAVAVDDFSELDRQPDGAVVSLVGWIRARE